MYLDPSSGSLVLQVIAAGVMSILAFTARARGAVKSFFKSMLSRRGTAKR